MVLGDEGKARADARFVAWLYYCLSFLVLNKSSLIKEVIKEALGDEGMKLIYPCACYKEPL